MMTYRYNALFIYGYLSHLRFRVVNDTHSVQGTAAVVLAGLLAALKIVGGSLADHTFLFFGAGEVGFSSTHVFLHN